jgi:hypothetical protein
MRLRSYSWIPQSEGKGAEWLAIYSPVFTSPEPALTGASGAHRIWASGSFVLSQATCERATLVHEPSVSPGLDHLGICLVLAGTIGLEASGNQTEAQAGDIALLDLRNSFRLIRGRENETTSELTLWLPRARLPAKLADATVIRRQLVRAGAAGTAVAAAALEALLPQLDATTAAEMNEIVTGVVGLAARVIALSARTKSSAPVGPAPLESFVTVSRFIEANLGARDLGVDKLARTFGIACLALSFVCTGGRRCVLYSNPAPRPRAPGTHGPRPGRPSDRTNRLPCRVPKYPRFQSRLSRRLWTDPAKLA